MPLASLNIQLGALEEHIMDSFLILTATRKTIAVGFSDPYGLPNISIHGVTTYSNLTQYISYEISKCWLLQYWEIIT